MGTATSSTNVLAEQGEMVPVYIVENTAPLPPAALQFLPLPYLCGAGRREGLVTLVSSR